MKVLLGKSVGSGLGLYTGTSVPVFLTFVCDKYILVTMIKVYFPPGCYGTYLSQCVYSYTNLRVEQFEDFAFSETGNSHQHRYNNHTKSVINCGHIETLEFDKTVDTVVVLPHNDHMLDYFNNQFVKRNVFIVSRYISIYILPILFV